MLYQTLSAPINCQIELTTSCSHNCSHCYNFWRKDIERVNNFLKETDVSKIIRKIADAKVFDIIITGGEPLIKYDILIHCIKEARSAGSGISLNSNLVSLTRARARELRSLGIKQILTSLMGPSAEIHDKIAQSKGSFERVVRNIQLANEEKINIVANMVVSKINLSFVRDTAKFVSSIGIKKFAATKAGCPGNCFDFSQFSLSKEEFKKYLQDLQEVGEELGIAIDALEGYPLCGIGDLNRYYSFIGRKCYAGVTTITIASDGEVRPCSHLDVSYGNLLTKDLAEIWTRMAPWRNGAYLPNTCKSCKILHVCGGGCRMEAKMRSGNISGMDPYSMPNDIEKSLYSLQEHQKNMFYKAPLKNFEIRPYRYRHESFGAVVLVGKSRAFLSATGLKLFKQFEISSTYSLQDERIQWGALNPVDFIRGLIQRGIAVGKQ